MNTFNDLAANDDRDPMPVCQWARDDKARQAIIDELKRIGWDGRKRKKARIFRVHIGGLSEGR